MCKAVENYANELAEERAKVLAEERAKALVEELTKENIEKTVMIVKNMLDIGISIEAALKCSNIDLQTYEKYSESVQ